MHQVACVNDSCHAYTLDVMTSHVWHIVFIRHDDFTCVTYLIFACVTYLIQTSDVYAGHESFTHAVSDVTHIRLMYTRDMNHSHMRCLMSRVYIRRVTRLNKICHTCEYESYYTRVNQPHVWMNHVTHVNESRLARVNESSRTCGCVMSRMWMSHVTRVNESCRTCEWVMSRVWMSHVAHVNESCHACEWVMSRVWLSHVAHVNESCHACEWVMSHMWMSHITHENELCHKFEEHSGICSGSGGEGIGYLHQGL